MPQISVIVPVYKVEEYLPRCIDSILAQTFTDFELILVDDGSPDNCGEICEKYAEKDSRVQVIHQENKGVSVARNLGIEKAQGKYTAFVDSDDSIHPQMYELLSSALDHTEYPFVHCGFHRLKDGERDVLPLQYTSVLDDIQELTSEQGMLRMMDWKNYGHYIWRGLYRTAYIKEIHFLTGIRWEDVIWSGEVVGKAGVYGFIPVDLYTYNTHSTSLVRTYKWETQQQYFVAFQRYMDLARKLTPRVSDQVELEILQAFIERENRLYLEGTLDSEAKNAINEAVKACNCTVKKVMRSGFSLRRKSLYLLCLVSFPLGCNVRRMLLR